MKELKELYADIMSEQIFSTIEKAEATPEYQEIKDRAQELLDMVPEELKSLAMEMSGVEGDRMIMMVEAVYKRGFKDGLQLNELLDD